MKIYGYLAQNIGMSVVGCPLSVVRRVATDNGPQATDSFLVQAKDLQFNNKAYKMKITKEEVLHVAHLARLDIDESNMDTLAGQIGKILDYVDMLSQVDTEGVKPTNHAIFLTNAFREDVETVQMDREKALLNAPDKQDGNFVVPKVID